MCQDKDTQCRHNRRIFPRYRCFSSSSVGHSSKIVPRLNMVLSPTNTIDVKYVAAILGEDKCNALIGLHSVTGCNTTGKMFQKSKKTWVNEFLVSNMAVVTSLRDLTTEDSTEKSITGIEKLFASVYCPQTTVSWIPCRKQGGICSENTTPIAKNSTQPVVH